MDESTKNEQKKEAQDAKMDELTRNERKEKAQDALRAYIENHIREGTYIASKAQIYKDLEKNNKTYGLSDKTFYRYMEEMKCKSIGSGKFIFDEKNESTYLNEFLVQRHYTNRMYFYINEPLLGPCLASIINEYYIDFKKVFHCIALQDLLICFYKKKKDSNGGLTSKEIKKDIEQCLQHYILQFKN